MNNRIYDINHDGMISDSDIETSNQLLELEIREEKANTQKKMAWMAIFSMIFFTAILFSPFISDSRVQSLSDLLGLFYIAQAGVVGAYMGVTAWMSNTQTNNSLARYKNYKKIPDVREPEI